MPDWRFDRAINIFEQIMADSEHCLFEISGKCGSGKTECAIEVGRLFSEEGKKVRMFEKGVEFDAKHIEDVFLHITLKPRDLLPVFELTVCERDSIWIMDGFDVSDTDRGLLNDMSRKRCNKIILTMQTDSDFQFKPVSV